MKHHAGFSLTELMVAVALLAILMSLGAPQFGETIARNRIASQANGFVAALNLARSEAIKRGARVVVCKVKKISGSDAPDFSRCDRAGDWSNGWIMFWDNPATPFADSTATFAPTAANVIQKHEGLGGSSLSGSGTDTMGVAYYMSYNGMGMVNPRPVSGVSFTFTLRPLTPGERQGRCINVNSVGRVEIARNPPDPNCPP
jgi:type IV fimbrial biogenesis protein FimT